MISKLLYLFVVAVVFLQLCYTRTTVVKRETEIEIEILRKSQFCLWENFLNSTDDPVPKYIRDLTEGEIHIDRVNKYIGLMTNMTCGATRDERETAGFDLWYACISTAGNITREEVMEITDWKNRHPFFIEVQLAEMETKFNEKLPPKKTELIMRLFRRFRYGSEPEERNEAKDGLTRCVLRNDVNVSLARWMP